MPNQTNGIPEQQDRDTWDNYCSETVNFPDTLNETDANTEIYVL